MKNILFRAKSVKNKEWVFGYIHPITENFIEKAYMHTIFGEYIEVVIDTISQYTGLNDKVKSKIFIGDICRFNLMKEDKPYLIDRVNEEGIVTFENYCGLAIGDWLLKYCADILIIGNKWDNEKEII